MKSKYGILDEDLDGDVDFNDYLWLDYIFKKFKWTDNYRDDIQRTLNIIINYFETCKDEDLAIYCYNMFLKHHKKNYSYKKLYDFYVKSMKELGVNGERPLQRLIKEIKVKGW